MRALFWWRNLFFRSFVLSFFLWAKKAKTLLYSPSFFFTSSSPSFHKKRTLRRERQILYTNTHTHTHKREGEGANSPRLASSSSSYFPPWEEREREREKRKRERLRPILRRFLQRRGRKYIEKETKQGTSVLSVYHIAQRSVVCLFVCLSVCLSVCRRRYLYPLLNKEG